MRRAAISAVGLFVLLAHPTVSFAGTGVSLNVGIVGSNSSTGLDDPVTVIKLPEVAKVMQAIADQPRTEQFIRQSLEMSDVGLEDLERLLLVQRRGGLYYLAFAYFTIEDHALILRTLAPHVDALVAAYQSRWPEFETIFQQYDIDSVPDVVLAYVIIGAFSMDWDGLDITAAKGLRTVAKEQASGDRFLLWAQETGPEASLREIYWGSHNDIVNDVRFVTFGDHDIEDRWGFPDLLWRVSSAVIHMQAAPANVSLAANHAMLSYYHNDMLADIGQLLLSARNGATSLDDFHKTTSIDRDRIDQLLRLLTELQYFEESDGVFQLLVPVLGEQDEGMLHSALQLSEHILAEWLDNHYEPMKSDLASLTAVQQGIPYCDLYTQIWHYTFGLANRNLARAGYFVNPYEEGRNSPGFVPFAFTVGIYADESGLAP